MRPFALLLALVLLLAAPTTTDGSGDGDLAEPLEWTRLGRPFGGGRVNELVALPDGAMLAVGSVGDASARVWHSPDGVGWEEIALPDRDHTWVRDAAGGDGGIVAVGAHLDPGERLTDTVVWSSPDGLEWSERRTLGQAVPVDALATEDGYAILTSGRGPDGPRPVTVWHSADGASWQTSRVAGAEAAIEAVAMERAAAGSWVVAGMGQDGAVRLWRSDDGRAWEPVPERTTAGWAMGRLAALPAGFVFVDPGTRNVASAGSTVWYSADGREWSEAATLEQPIMAMSRGPGGVIALVTPPDRYELKRDYPVAMLRSEDGRSWSGSDVPEFRGKPFKRITMMPDGQVLAIRQLNDITWLGRPSDAPRLIMPEPTSNARGELLDFRALVKRAHHPDGEFDQVGASIIDYFETAGDDLDPLHLLPPIDDLVRDCKRFMRKHDDRFWCMPVFLRLHLAHGLSRDPLPYELAGRWLGVTMNGDRAYRTGLLERLKWNRVAHPDWFKS